jgi:hypothetical protein
MSYRLRNGKIARQAEPPAFVATGVIAGGRSAARQAGIRCGALSPLIHDSWGLSELTCRISRLEP